MDGASRWMSVHRRLIQPMMFPRRLRRTGPKGHNKKAQGKATAEPERSPWVGGLSFSEALKGRNRPLQYHSAMFVRISP